jgi:hypothetical protein
MNSYSPKDSIESLGKFRQRIYESFPVRRDATMNLLDSLCANTVAGSVVELSLNAPFERTYSSVCDAIDNFEIGADGHGQAAEDEGGQARTARARIVAEHIPPPSRERPFWLFGVDTTPNPRPFATTLSDRGVVYRPNPAPGNKPIVVGHTYSVAAALPERSPPRSSVDRSHGLSTRAHREESHRHCRRADRRIVAEPIAPLRRGIERGSRRFPLQPCRLPARDRRLRQSCRAGTTYR